MSDTTKMDFKLERYKHLNNEISRLNGNIHTYLNQYQTITATIIAGAVFIFINWQQYTLVADIAIKSIKVLYFSLALFSGFMIIRLIAGIYSWLDYRKEETNLLNEVLDDDFRKKPNFRNLWRWDELYSILIIFIVPIIFIVFCELHIIPNIK